MRIKGEASASKTSLSPPGSFPTDRFRAVLMTQFFFV